jgi:methyl-accepting chemotaxis protein
MKKNTRRNIFIKKSFQARLILGYLLFVATGCLLFLGLLTFLAADTLTIGSPHASHGHTPLILVKELLAGHWLLLVAGAALLVLVAMRITHRLAGPLFSFERTLDQMLSGDLNQTIKLRSSDEGKELAQKINAFNTELSKNLKMIGSHADAMAILLEQVENCTRGNPSCREETLPGLLWALEEKRKKIKNLCRFYLLHEE